MSPAFDIDVASMSPTDVPAAVQVTLERYISSRRLEVTTIGSPVSGAVNHLADFVLGGGKRIRPLFGWAGFVGAGGLSAGDEDPEAVLTAVSSLEFIQACALIHDDIIDNSDTRRGKPAVHRAVATQHSEDRWLGNSEHFGTSLAILVGDLGLAWADDMLFDASLTPAAIARTRGPWRAMRTEVIGGQLLDITLEAMGNEDITLSRAVNRYKTAAYTIERPLHLGAAIAGASDELITAFRGYGHDIGIAFQLRDDLLGVFGDPSVTGKDPYDDLREGKRTELLALAINRADATDPAAAAKLRAGVGVVDTHDELAELAGIIESTGAVADIESMISELTASGLAHLTAAGVADDVTETLHQLAIRATERRS